MLVAFVRQAFFGNLKYFPQTLLRLKASPLTDPAVGDKGQNVCAGRFLFVVKMCLYIKDSFFVESIFPFGAPDLFSRAPIRNFVWCYYSNYNYIYNPKKM